MEQTFFQRFEALCKANGESPNAVAKAIGAASGSVTAWKRGTTPRNATVTRLADYFGVTTDYLLGQTDSSADLLDAADIAFYGDFKELTDDQKQTVRDMVRLMLERRTKE